MISIVFPVYNEEGNVEKLHSIIKRTMDDFGESYEIIAVDDGSKDKTLEVMKKLSPLRTIVFARNYGQTSALDAGLKAAKGEIVITLDADLQNDPKDIPRLINKLREGYDVVSGWRRDRHDNFGRKILSRLANWLTRKVTGLFLHDYACALKAYRKTALIDLNLYGEMHVFLPAILYMRGAKIAEMQVSHHARTVGFSKHNFLKAVKDISDLFVIKFIFSVKRPLIVFVLAGFILFFLSLISIAISISLTFLAMGFVAEMLMRVYYESKDSRPYIIREILEN
ncbi:MAG: glycosyltransferase family 2 protein [Patescibacteria group bacterium]|mgnify:CR=1 FL=1